MSEHFACYECHRLVDMRVTGSARVGAHSRDFCSMKCADAWEANPVNADAVSESHRAARDAGWPYDPKKILP